MRASWTGAALVVLSLWPALADDAPDRVIVWSAEVGGERVEYATDGSFSRARRTGERSWTSDGEAFDAATLRARHPAAHAAWTATSAPITSALTALSRATCEQEAARAGRALVEASRSGARRLVLHRVHAAAAADPLDDVFLRRVRRVLDEVDEAERARLRATLTRLRRAWVREAGIEHGALTLLGGHLLVVRGAGAQVHGFVVVGDRVDVETWQADRLLEVVELTTLDDLARRRPDLHARWTEGRARLIEPMGQASSATLTAEPLVTPQLGSGSLLETPEVDMRSLLDTTPSIDTKPTILPIQPQPEDPTGR